MLEQIKFEGLLDKSLLGQFVDIFAPSVNSLFNFQIYPPTIETINSFPIQFDNKQVPPLSGLSCFFYGHIFETIQKNYQQAFEYYKFGGEFFMDPLCCHKLSQIYSHDNQFNIVKNKRISYFYLIPSINIEIYYAQNKLFGTKTIIKALAKEIDQCQTVTQEIIQSRLKELGNDIPISHFEKILIETVKFHTDNSHYSDLVDIYLSVLNDCKQQPYVCSIIILELISLVIQPVKTDNKKITKIIDVLKGLDLQSYKIVVQQLCINIQIMSHLQKDDGMFEKTREYFFEIIFIVKNILRLNPQRQQISSKMIQLESQIWNFLAKSSKLLYNLLERIEKQIHQSLIIRIQAKIIANYGDLIDFEQLDNFINDKNNFQEAIEIQQKELQMIKSNKLNYAIPQFNLAKLYLKANLMDNFQHHSKLARELLQIRLDADSHTDLHSQLITLYFLSRLDKLLKNQKDEKKYLESAMRQLNNLKQNQKSLLQNTQALMLVRTFQYHVIEQKIKKRLQFLDKDLKETVEKQEQLELLQDQIQNISSQNPWNLEKSSADLSQGTKLLQSQKNNFHGPVVISMLETNKTQAQVVIVEYSKQLNEKQLETQNSLELRTMKYQEEDGLIFVRSEDVFHRQLLQKGSTSGVVTKVLIQGKIFAMKSIVAIKQGLFDKLLCCFKAYVQLNHPNLRKIFAFLAEKDQNIINLGLIYQFYQLNLYALEFSELFSLKQRVQILLDIINAVIYLNQFKQFHRYLKPSNVFINDQFQGIVADWEISDEIFMELNDDAHLALFGWSSPEFYNELRITPQSDSWTIGALILLIIFKTNVERLSREQDQSPYDETWIHKLINQINYNEEIIQIKFIELTKKLLQIDPNARLNLNLILLEIQQINQCFNND